MIMLLNGNAETIIMNIFIVTSVVFDCVLCICITVFLIFLIYFIYKLILVSDESKKKLEYGLGKDCCSNKKEIESITEIESSKIGEVVTTKKTKNVKVEETSTPINGN
ncbi:MAG: hypothetical protein R3Y64_10240 [Peptostreptococcaceae bacterium]